ncbi:membrane spanning protein in TonB-ExbB-ExbD complex [uncultured Alphaproteobacteria bacterium]|uniref:Membrane spanning protein in TonB-ExbB-ExbD complex n=1 Tax=uncultured Alphaproteobacteria bacterium TaxID=91750 RepID=A0A212KI30_9PROT|nr:membrane spanning protein in TonB-ExbB-ExbD complex [uncultured Alphaproteobacteria bacterium]
MNGVIPVPEIIALSPWRMFLDADAVVQSVMVGLFLASVATWTIALAKGLAIRAAIRRIRALAAGRAIACAEAEIPAIADGEGGPGALDRAERAMARAVARRVRAMRAGVGALASIGAVAPFVGLFGTVWGIMNSFIGIAASHTTNLAVVAPGIAEALLATALGLVAAIPAVVLYNLLARGLAAYRAELDDLAAAALARLSRNLAAPPHRFDHAAE